MKRTKSGMSRSSLNLVRTLFLISCVTLCSHARSGTLDWQALARVHAQALDHYRNSPASRRGAERTAVCRMLKAAGADRAVTAPVAGITPIQAAAILNDFGFLATPDCSPWPVPEQAIRRALALDPHRNVARLNLGDVLRLHLQSVLSGGVDPDGQRAEIRRAYQAFLDGGGARTLDMGHWSDPPPKAGPPGEVCRVIKGYLDADRLMELMSGSAEHVRTATGLVNIAIHYEGTGLAPKVVATREADGKKQVLAEGAVRADAAIVGTGDDVQVLILERGLKSGYTVPLTGHPACDLSRDSEEVVSADSAEPAVCHSLMTSDDIREVGFNDPPDISDDALATRWSGQYSGVHAVASALVDIANSGQPVRVVRMETSLRQPDLCTVQLNEILSIDGNRLPNDEERAALTKLGIHADDPMQPDADCYSETHYLLQGHRTLVELLEHSQGDTNAPDQRRVDINERGQWRQLCATRSVSRWLVETATTHY